MKIDFSGRGFEITTAIREHTESKLSRLKKHLDDIRDVSVVLSAEKYRQRAEIKFTSLKTAFYGQEETSDMLTSVDRVVEKLEKQARRFKEKRVKNRKKPSDTIKDTALAAPEGETAEKPGEQEVKIIRMDNFVVKPMSLEEAVAELQKLKQEFLVFQNSESEAVNVVFRRKDGHFGYIEAAV